MELGVRERENERGERGERERERDQVTSPFPPPSFAAPTSRCTKEGGRNSELEKQFFPGTLRAGIRMVVGKCASVPPPGYPYFLGIVALSGDRRSLFAETGCKINYDHGTHKTVKARFWPWLSGKSS